MAELKLNIYSNERDGEGNRIIEKTYKTSTCDMLWGPVEDILGVIDLENMNDNNEIVKVLFTVISQIKPILKDVFYGLTDEELRRISSKEIVPIVFAILQEAINGILEDENIKNLMGGMK